MRIGFTTSFPIEVPLSAGHQIMDLNNIFMSELAGYYFQKAEQDGYPRNLCAWIKGMHGVALSIKPDLIVGIVQGDCSNTHSLMQQLKDSEIAIVPFSYPYNAQDIVFLDEEIKKLERYFGVDRQKTEALRQELLPIRKRIVYLDELTWKEEKVTGFENHIWQVSASDFKSDYRKFGEDLELFIDEAEQRERFPVKKRLAYLGVPPIIPEIYEFLEEHGAYVVFNEVQRQFSMPYVTSDIVEQYMRFTYPYDIFSRLKDIREQLALRKIDGIISYGQLFCHRQLDQLILKKYLDYPFLPLEADEPNNLDERTKLRLEAFLDLL